MVGNKLFATDRSWHPWAAAFDRGDLPAGRGRAFALPTLRTGLINLLLLG